MTQEKLAERAALSVRAVRYLEQGRVQCPRWDTVRLLADALCLTGVDRERFEAAAGSRVRPEGETPAQLPPDVYGFTGRVGELAWLDAVLAAAPEQPTAVVISAVTGTAGVGKTALAVHWAHQARARFPDGQLYVDLGGFDRSGSAIRPAEAIRGFLDAFAVPPHRIPADLHAQVGLYRSVLADRRVLIVLDNARDTEQVRPLLPGSPGCVVVVTSRNRLTGLAAAEGAHVLTLDLLTDAEASHLFAGRLGRHRVAAEPAAVDEIIMRCAGLPLALVVAAARLVTELDLSLAALAGQLREASRLDALAGGDASADVRAVFSWSYQSLELNAARLFRLLGLHPGPDISAAAAGSLAGLGAAQVRPLLAELKRAHLVVEPRPGRYSSHDLLRDYARDLVGHDPADQRKAAVARLLDHYQHTGHAAALLVEPSRDPIPLPRPQPGTELEHLAGREQAIGWFAAEHRVLLAVLQSAASASTGGIWAGVDCDAQVGRLAWVLADYLNYRGHWQAWLTAQRTAADAARRRGDRSAEGVALLGAANASIRLCRFEQARQLLAVADQLFGESGDHTGRTRSHYTLAQVLTGQGDHAEALVHAEQALQASRLAADPRAEGRVLNLIGWCHAAIGDYRPALTACEQAASRLQQVGDVAGEAAAWDSLGYAHNHLDDHVRAIACYRHALEIYQFLGDRYYQAETLAHLGDAQHAAGDAAAARGHWHDALAIFDDLAHPAAGELRQKLNRPAG